jgi:hypothetical protein
MFCRKIIAVYSEIHTKRINTLCGENVELMNVKPGGTSSDHWATKGLNICYENQSVDVLWENNRC